ncbi:hypothetical protein [Cardinium endosymbiont of Nabis limbatus]|uniref:hypothetical protein n=1 Tax=Cardinium endosymbiont of Nabis limbatus TaxID=3066217 RepID=UPI003AF383C9
MIPIVTTYTTVGSCECVKKNKTIPSEKLSGTAPPTTPVDKRKSEGLHASTDSIASQASNSSGDSGYTSSGASSGSSYSEEPPVATDPRPFAGLANLGSTCYMNAVLQVIAALYEDEAKGRCLDDLITKINSPGKPLSEDYIRKYIERFPQATKDFVNLGEQQDSDEFIEHIKDHFLCLGNDANIYPITCTETLFLKRKSDNQYDIYRYDKEPLESHMLYIGIKKGYNLSQMIRHHQEQVLKGDVSVEIDWNKPSLCKDVDTLPPFVQQNQAQIAPVVGYHWRGVPRDCIKQTVLRLPDKLYIKLDRNVNESKITDSVDGTMKITIQPDPNKQNGADTFDLNGCIEHRGDGTKGGHYVAYVKRGEKWYEADDKQVKEVGAPKAGKAYLFFYKKQKK